MRKFIISTPTTETTLKCHGTLLARLTAQHMGGRDGKADLIDGETGEVLRIY